MTWHHHRRGHWLAGIGLLAALAIAGTDLTTAQARGRHGVSHAVHARSVHGSDYRPPYAAIVVDDNTGQSIYEVNADEPRHPASVTKVMTLYVLFEQIEAGKFKLDTPLPISKHAAGQAPVKLGLKAGQTITVDEAIRAMVTKSANDAAAVVGEAIGDADEAEGARRMTNKALALGMTNTIYVNTSGLPAEEQITTARDQALLGLAIQNRFPKFYHYFSTPSFTYHGREMHNHNALLGNVKGVDGLKTGFTEASGYNLLASVHRDNRHIVAVVLGGTSGAARDARMRQLIEDHIVHAATERTAAPITETATADDPPDTNPIGSAPNAVAATSKPEFNLASVNSNEKSKSEEAKQHIRHAAMAHGHRFAARSRIAAH